MVEFCSGVPLANSTLMTIHRRPLSNCLTDTAFPLLLQRLYSARGIQSASALDLTISRLLPFTQLKGIDNAVRRLYQALQQQQRILIVADFDADGATSCALAITALHSVGAQYVTYLVPNRFEYGYGLTPEIVDVAAQRQPQLIITVDNGISSVDGVERANQLGIDVIITDHHLAASVLPEAVAIVNPNQVGDEFPSKHLAGVGVIFYVMLALRSYLREHKWFETQGLAVPNMAELLDLVCLGTVADVVPLDQNNRILVEHGLRRIRAEKNRPGIQALLHIANRQNCDLTASDLGFALGPRLNAAGRLEDMSLGIECLLAKNFAQALTLAQRLDELNRQRRDIEATMQQQATDTLANLQLTQQLPIGLCLHDARWHQGVIGIVAARIKERTYRPTIVFASVDNNILKGSARSVPGLHIRDVLDAIAKRHPELIQKFGGHAMAAGLSIDSRHFTLFSEAFATEVAYHLTSHDLQDCVISDGGLTKEELQLATAELLRSAGPWGQQFPEPLFDDIFEIVDQYLVSGKHLKMSLRLSADSPLVDAIAFFVNVEEWPNYRAQKIHAVYRLAINNYRGQKKLQLMVERLWVAA